PFDEGRVSGGGPGEAERQGLGWCAPMPRTSRGSLFRTGGLRAELPSTDEVTRFSVGHDGDRHPGRVAHEPGTTCPGTGPIVARRIPARSPPERLKGEAPRLRRPRREALPIGFESPKCRAAG